MRPHSITFHLTLFFSTVSTAVLLAVGAVSSALVDAHFEEQDRTELEGKLELVTHVLSRVGTPPDQETVAQRLADAMVGHPGLSIAVTGPDRRILFASRGPEFPAEMLMDAPGARAGEPADLVVWEEGGRPYRGIRAPIPTGVAGAPPLTVAVALGIQRHRDFLASFRASLWWAIAACIALTALLGWIAARRGLAPVREMARVTQGTSAQRLGSRLASESVPIELVDLAQAFNEMLARLGDSFRRLSEFSSDLAHELRTPISNLMTQTQVAISKDRSAAEYRDVLYSNLEEYERLARMIGDMLFLAKADNGLIMPSREEVDLATAVREVFGYYEAYAEDQGVGLALAGAGTIAGDRPMIRRALNNLLSNAIRHAPRGACVQVCIERCGSAGVRLIVENPGDDIAPEHLPRLFDRFYRVDPSRQKASEGAGLGLAITKSIVEAHQGSIEAASERGVIRFTLTFPAMPPG